MAVLSVLYLVACSSDDDGNDYLFEQPAAFVGSWEADDANRDFILFKDGSCWMCRCGYDYVDEKGYWTYDSDSKILATTTEGRQWRVTLNNESAWVGITLGSNHETETFVRDTAVVRYLLRMLKYSSWEEKSDSILSLGNYREFDYYSHSDSAINFNGFYLGESTIEVDSANYMELVWQNEDFRSSYSFAYKLYNFQKIVSYDSHWGWYDYYYKAKLVGKGTAKFTNFDIPAKTQLKLTGTINKTFRRKD